MRYEKELNSLLKRLKNAGWTPVRVNDGGEDKKVSGWDEAKDMILSVEESGFRVNKGDMSVSLVIVLGNSPGELVSDYYYSSEEERKEIDLVVDAHYDYWDGKK